jgi:hypothetical protein
MQINSGIAGSELFEAVGPIVAVELAGLVAFDMLQIETRDFQ